MGETKSAGIEQDFAVGMGWSEGEQKRGRFRDTGGGKREPRTWLRGAAGLQVSI